MQIKYDTQTILTNGRPCEDGKENRSSENKLEESTTSESRKAAYNEVNAGRKRRGPITHGETCGGKKTKTYIAWKAMIQRTSNPNSSKYRYYGGKGISMCEEWRKSFQAFKNHIGNPPSEKHSIDRIDNKKGYIPGNVRWATQYEQTQNQSQTKLNPAAVISLRNEKRLLKRGQIEQFYEEKAKVFGVRSLAIRRAINGWSWKNITEKL